MQRVGLSTSKPSVTQAWDHPALCYRTPDPGVIVVHCKVLIIHTTKRTPRTSGGKRYDLARGVHLYIFLVMMRNTCAFLIIGGSEAMNTLSSVSEACC